MYGGGSYTRVCSTDVGACKDSTRGGTGSETFGRGSGRVVGAGGKESGRLSVAARTGTEGRGRAFVLRGGGIGADVFTRRGTFGRGRVRLRSSLIEEVWVRSRKDVCTGYCDRASGICGLEGAEQCGVMGRGWNDHVEDDADELVELDDDIE